MKTRMASLTILCLMLATVPAWADYNNGPINGSVGAWDIVLGYIVSDTFSVSSAKPSPAFRSASGTNWMVP